MTTSDTYAMTSAGEIVTVTGRIIAVLDPDTGTEEAVALLGRLNATPVVAGQNDQANSKNEDSSCATL